MSTPVIDEASLERQCVRLVQAVDRETYSAAAAHSDEHDLWHATVVAVGWMYMELERAVVELESALDLQQEDGRLPATASGDGAALPLISTIARMIYHGCRSRQRSLEGRLARLVPALDRYHAWLESHSQRHLYVWQPGDARALGPEAPAVDEAQKDVGFNALLIQADSDLADVAIHTGYPTRLIIARRTRRAQSMASHLWWEEEEIFASRRGGERVEAADAEVLLPLWSGAALARQARRMVDRHLPPGGVFWTERPICAVTASGVVSPLLNWLLIRGLFRYGLEEMAGQLNDALLAMVSEAGIYPAYDAHTGQGLGQEGAASTAALVLDLIKTPYHYDRW